MSSVTIKVLSTVNAPYGTNLSVEQLASKISGVASVENFDASASAFYSEVEADLQHQFLNEMGIDHGAASEIAQKFSQLAGYPLALAAEGCLDEPTELSLEPVHPTLNDLKFEIGQVLVYWSFLENSMRRHLTRAGLQDQTVKGPVISHWRAYIRNTYPDQAHELLKPVEKLARVRNFLAHSIYSLRADPWTEGSAVITCAAADGILYYFSIDDFRAASTELSELMVRPIRSFAPKADKPTGAGVEDL